MSKCLPGGSLAHYLETKSFPKIPLLYSEVPPPRSLTKIVSSAGEIAGEQIEIASSETHSPPTRSPTKIVSSAAGGIAGEQMSARW